MIHLPRMISARSYFPENQLGASLKVHSRCPKAFMRSYFPENQLGASLKAAIPAGDLSVLRHFPENQLGASLKEFNGKAIQALCSTSPRTNSGPH